MATIADRIKEALEIRNMKQVDLVEKTKIGKSSISTYISGAYEPKQKNIYKIAKALNVNEAWLMGYDVPMERVDMDEDLKCYKERMLQFANSHNKNFFENKLLNSFNKLNDDGKKEAIKRIDELSELPKYQKYNVTTLPKREKQIWEEPGKEYLMPIACHDDGLTDEEKENMNNIIDNFLKNKK